MSKETKTQIVKKNIPSFMPLYVVLIHLLFTCLSFYYFTDWFVLNIWGRYKDNLFAAIPFNEWAINVMAEMKFYELGVYMLSIVLIFSIFVFAYVLIKKQIGGNSLKHNAGKISKTQIFNGLFISIVCNLLFCQLLQYHSEFYIVKILKIIFVVSWPLIAILMLIRFGNKTNYGIASPVLTENNRNIVSNISLYLTVVFTFCLILLTVFSLYPLCFGKLYLGNELAKIDESTRMSSRYVNNSEFIAKHNFGAEVKSKSTEKNKLGALPKFAAEESDFINKNYYELEKQAKAGFFFHHHAQIFAPIQKYLHNGELSEIKSQYGKVLTIFLAVIVKSYKQGAPAFNFYYNFINMFYFLYIIIVLIVSLLIFGRTGLMYTLLSLVAIITAIFGIGFDSLMLAPGFNPIRHIFDLPVLFMFYLFCVKDYKSKYFAAILITAVFAILWSRESGFFLYLAVFVGMLVKIYLDSKYTVKNKFLMLVALLLPMFLLLPGSTDDTIATGSYLYLGLWVPYLLPGTLGWVTLVLILLLLIVFIGMMKTHPQRVFYVFLWVYIVLNTIYYIWCPAPNHFWSVILLCAVPIVILLKAFLEEWNNCKYYYNCILGFAVLLLTIYFLYPPILKFKHSKEMLQEVFHNHKIVRWNTGEIDMITTMNLENIDKDMELAERYMDKERGVFLLSDADEIISVVLNVHNNIPSYSLKTDLVTKIENEKLLNYVKKIKPEYILADKDILSGDVQESAKYNNIYLQFYSDLAVRRLVIKELRNNARNVLNDYSLVEVGQLLSVYKRKNQD